MKTINWNNHILSKLCLGTVQFGLDYGVANSSGKIPQNEVNNILDIILFSNINVLDTGSMYGNSEEKIGTYIKSNRKMSFNIISKIKSDFFIDKENAINKINISLNNLNINTLFGLLLHNIDAIKTWNNCYSDILIDLKTLNKIKYFGISIYTDEEFNLALNNNEIDIIQIPFSILDQRAIYNKWFYKAKKKNKLILIRSIYLQGLIFMNIDNIPSYLLGAKKYIKEIENICNRLKITKSQLALSFVETIAKDSIILFGCDNAIQAQENIYNFNNLPKLNKNELNFIKEYFSSVGETIYNPTKWK